MKLNNKRNLNIQKILYYVFDACCEWQSSCQNSQLAFSIAQEGISFAKDPP